jgi:DNA-binding NarL/FixJ family response regulator
MEARKFKTILVDDHELYRDGLKLFIENENLGIVTGEADNGLSFLKLIENEKPDIAIIDINMPVMDGIEASEKAIAKYPDINILILSMHGDQNYYTQLINIGVKGFLLKTAGKKELEDAFNSVAKGNSYFSSELLRRIILEINRPQTLESLNKINPDFTERELEILMLFCNGFTANEIASKISLSVKTVEAYRSKLLHKTGARHTIALVIYAIKNKIVVI